MFVRLRLMRWLLFMLGILVSAIFIYHLICHPEIPSLSDTILILTALVIAWTSIETQAIVELTRTKEKPLLEVSFPDSKNQFRNKIVLTNLGQSPAYSPKIASVIIDNEIFEFDPLGSSRLPIQPNESREVWVYHTQIQDDGSKKSVGNVVPQLEKAIIKDFKSYLLSPRKLVISYFDSVAQPCKRELYLRVGGVAGQAYIYTSTSPD